MGKFLQGNQRKRTVAKVAFQLTVVEQIVGRESRCIGIFRVMIGPSRHVGLNEFAPRVISTFQNNVANTAHDDPNFVLNGLFQRSGIQGGDSSGIGSRQTSPDSLTSKRTERRYSMNGKPIAPSPSGIDL